MTVADFAAPHVRSNSQFEGINHEQKTRPRPCPGQRPAKLRMIEANASFKLINEAFPHIGKKLRFFWGQPEFSTYVEGLQSNTSGTSRAGFPGEILMAICSLALAHDVAHPELIANPSDIWSH